ncbi:response regulator [Methanobacterium sp.]|uniref:response regulator n=1 Tax=Methanobacterium sp. TaxID=2164 RepID=UPI0031583694
MSELKILIVEDEGIISLEITQILQSQGYQPYAVFSNEDVIEKAQEIQPNLVLMDIKLNGEDECIKKAIKIREMMNVPIVYLTGCADKTTLNAVKSTTSCDYILKPFDEEELVSTIEMALNKHNSI